MQRRHETCFTEMWSQLSCGAINRVQGKQMGLLSKSKVKCYLVAIFLLAWGFARASEFQVFSVKENPAGTVIATIGIFTGDTPAASAFKLKLDDKTMVPAREVKPAKTSELP